jgi:hypothetical protein
MTSFVDLCVDSAIDCPEERYPPQTNCGEALGGNEGIRLRRMSKTPAMTDVLVPLEVSLRAFEVLPNEGVYVVIREASYGIVWH